MVLLTLILVFIQEIIIDDFLVNDDTSGGCLQWRSSVSINRDGNFIVAWADFRSTDYDGDIYCQRYTEGGNPIGENFKVNNDSGGPYWNPYWLQIRPIVANFEGENFVIVWEDWRNGEPDIYGQIYDSIGMCRGINFRVNDDYNSKQQFYPWVSMSISTFVVVWEDWRNGNADIYAQIYDSLGTTKGINFRINDNIGSSNQLGVSVSMSDSGSFVVVWEDWRNGDADIYGQLYDSNGSPVGSNFKVNANFNSSSQQRPTISSDSLENFIVVWEDWRDGNASIYGKIYDGAGNSLVEDFKISKGEKPSVWMNDREDFVIVWEKGTDGIYGRIYNLAGVPQAEEFKISSDVSDKLDPRVTINEEIIVTWTDYRENNPDIYGQRFNLSGVPQGSNFKINNDGASSYQDFPAIGMDSTGNFVIIWYDYRNGSRGPYNDPDIYGQKYNKSGEPCGSNFRINDDGTQHAQLFPSLSMNRNGNFIVVWQDNRQGTHHIYGQKYNEFCQPTGVNFKASSISGSNAWPGVCINDSGTTVVVWQNYNYSYCSVWGQRYNLAGEPLGGNFKIHSDVESEKMLPCAGISSSGSFVVVWIDYRSTSGGVGLYAQRYDEFGNPLGENFKVSDTTSPNWSFSSIAMHKSGSFIICWMDTRNEDWDIYAQIYDSLGTPLDKNFRVNDDVGSSEQNNPSVAIDELGRFIVTWTDFRNGTLNIMAQAYSPDGTQLGTNTQVNTNAFWGNHQWAWESVATNGDLIAFTWIDNRRLKGWDIYARLTDWENFFVEELTQEKKPVCSLHVYPNPCRGRFNVFLAEPNYIELYDISGKLYKKIGKLEEGKQFINNKEIPNGIYFLKVKGTSISQKIVILR